MYKGRKALLVSDFWPMLVQANEHHASIDKSPVRKPGISYIEVSLHRGDMMDLILIFN